MDYDIHNNENASRFETTVDGQLAFAEYRLEPGRITFTHTEVPQELSGRGIANAIVQYALDDARSRNLEVLPHCQFVRTYIQRHPEYQDLVRH